jgi:hypothetical protein
MDARTEEQNNKHKVVENSLQNVFMNLQQERQVRLRAGALARAGARLPLSILRGRADARGGDREHEPVHPRRGVGAPQQEHALSYLASRARSLVPSAPNPAPDRPMGPSA